jgi:hypothetical protein
VLGTIRAGFTRHRERQKLLGGSPMFIHRKASTSHCTAALEPGPTAKGILESPTWILKSSI